MNSESIVVPANVPSPERIAGCLLGQSVADSLAILLRGLSAVDARHLVDETISKWIDNKSLDDAPECLFITEGSQLSWEIVQLCVEQHGFVAPVFAKRIKYRLNRGLIYQRYWETHLTVKHLRAGHTWSESSVDSLGCGSIARAPAIGALYWGDEITRWSSAELQSRVTHNNHNIGAASVMIANLIADRLCHHGDTNLTLFAVPENAPELEQVLGRLPALLTAPPAAVLAEIVAQSAGDGIADHFAEGLLWALYCTLYHEWNYNRAVCSALTCGGELVAPVALVGALCGAAQGITGIPTHLLDRLSDQGVHHKSDFLKWCQQCHEFSVGAYRAA